MASDSFAPGAPRHFRLQVASGAPGVFHQQRFLLWGDFRNPAPDKAELRRLIEMAGGTVVNRADEGVRVICDPLLTPADRKKVLKVADVPLTSDYILDCISFCRYDDSLLRSFMSWFLRCFVFLLTSPLTRGTVWSHRSGTASWMIES